MLVKIKLKDIYGFRVAAIKELRELTGMGLKEAVDLLPSEAATAGTILEVNADPSKVRNKFVNFDVLVPADTLQERIKECIKLAVDSAEYDTAINLVQVLQRIK